MRALVGDADQRLGVQVCAERDSNCIFGLTLGLALAAHLLVILGVRIEPPRPDRRAVSTVEVVVLHQPAPRAAVPDKVAAPAQSTQSGGGEGQRDATTRQEDIDGVPETLGAASPTLDLDLDAPPPEEPPPAPAAIMAPQPVPESIPDAVPQATKPSPEPPAPDDTQALSIESAEPDDLQMHARPVRPPPAPPTVSAAEILASRNQELARLAARIEEKTGVFASRPRRTSVSSSTKEYKYATYLEAWRRKVEQIGNLNYPEEARRRGLHGNLILRVAVRADGSVEKVQVLRSSGFNVLDDAAVHIVELAAPYAPFPPDIAAETDILDITRTWQFQRNNQLGWGN
jgi:periplasmic protein TonB